MAKLRNILLSGVMAMALTGLSSVAANAQDYYDDDIYYSPSKAAEKDKKEAEKRAALEKAEAERFKSGSTDAPVATAMPLAVDVDTYNRNGGFLVPVEDGADSIPDTDFSYTRRIERFHNPDVITETGDTALMQYYYATQPANINVYVVEPDPFYTLNPWLWRYGYPYAWGYNPYYYGWGYDPYWSFCWGWGPCWGWGGPAWYPGGWHHGHGWGGPAYAWRPTSPGASRPHAPVYAGGAAYNGYRRSGNNAYTPAGTLRPGNSGRGRISTGTNVSNRYSPVKSNSSNSYSPSNSGRGRNNSSVNSSRSGYNSSHNYNSGSSFRSGSSGTHRSTGGGGFGGGGGGRGRR